MCGIIGTFPTPAEQVIKIGVGKLKHRGPDADDVISTHSCTLGHTRLSIIDVENGHQPMGENYQWLVFNGEVYNFIELREFITTDLNTQSDTEVVLALYRQFGPACVALLDGMFAFAISDDDKFFLARDPLGIKPLYYINNEDVLYFASEAKALHHISNEIKEFPAGHWWHSDYGLRQYYQLSQKTIFQQTISSGSYSKSLVKIREKLQHAVEKRMIADEDVPVGVSLSGGLDSSLVAAFAKDVKDNLDTFVVGIKGSPDLVAAKEMAEYLGTVHHVYQYDLNEMVSVLPEVIYHLESFDAPLIRSAIPNYFLAKLASQSVKVILTGEGADELYAGYEYLVSLDNPDELQRELLVLTGNLHNTNLQRADRMSMAFGLEARVPFLDQEFVDYSLGLPATWKLRTAGQPEKELLRAACQGVVPESILHRPKQKFSEGAGSMDMLSLYANEKISDVEYQKQNDLIDLVGIRSKEEYLYYQIFNDLFGETLSSTVIGRTRSITSNELQ